MQAVPLIYLKLEAFIKKYYTNELLRGMLLFCGLGLIYLILTLCVEYFLWLKPAARTVLFICFVAVELYLLCRYIVFPLFKLFKLQKGINYNEASAIIGTHFAEVSDKLTNFLQLESNTFKSDLLIASIEQKANALQIVPFSSAVNFNANKKLVPLALIPILFLLFFYISGNDKIISQSLNRVVHFKEQFRKPAPFYFKVLNRSLEIEQGKDFIFRVKTIGNVSPENVSVIIDNETYFMQRNEFGEFQFTFINPRSAINFHVEANAVSSDDFMLTVVAVPAISNFEMVLKRPSYLNKPTQIVKGTGNAVVPEGTLVTWMVNAQHTNTVDLMANGFVFGFKKSFDAFLFEKKIVQNYDYQIRTSNDKVRNYEKLNYSIAVIKDQFPSITVASPPDSLKVANNYVLGQISDDYGLFKLNIVYFPNDNPSQTKRRSIAIKTDLYDKFVFQFPSNLPIVDGVAYEYFFEVFDNDAPNGFKSAKSSSFSYRENTASEKEDLNFKQQNENINSLSKSLQTQTKQLNEMDKLKKLGQEKDNLDFKDQKKVDDFIERQKKQDEMMKEFTNKIKENLDKTKSDKKDEVKELLKDRLEKTKNDIEKNQKLLDELNKLNEKLSKEELFEKIEKFKQTSKNQTKSLQQLVELTKRFYVEKKAEQIAKKLDELSEKQNNLSDKDKENTVEAQDEINKEFAKLQEELKELQKENKELKKPLDIPDTQSIEKSVSDDLKKAADELKKAAKSSAKPKQKSAAKKMKQISGDMQSEMEGGDREQMEEDVAMLRQILDNLVAYSFSQEDVLKQFKNLKRGAPAFNKNLKIQQDLKQQFKHVDDSLFAMSLRNPRFEENITKEIGNVQYNIDKSIETLADANVAKGVSYQQFAEAASNRLADFLADILTNMQMSLSMKGSGKGKGTPSPGKGSGSGDQLPDIIQKQGDLSDKAKKGMEKGKKPGEGKDGQDGKDGQGKSGGDKQGGKEGNGKAGSGKQGGADGQNGQDSENNAQQIMEIYKEQQQLREALQNELSKQGLGAQGQNAIDQMKQLEKQLLNKGFNNEVLQRMLNLKYELLKLEKAVQLQGEDKKRQSETNKKEFSNTSNALPARLQDYINSIEILNRQVVPLQPIFNQKVQKYFKNND